MPSNLGTLGSDPMADPAIAKNEAIEKAERAEAGTCNLRAAIGLETALAREDLPVSPDEALETRSLLIETLDLEKKYRDLPGPIHELFAFLFDPAQNRNYTSQLIGREALKNLNLAARNTFDAEMANAGTRPMSRDTEQRLFEMAQVHSFSDAGIALQRAAAEAAGLRTGVSPLVHTITAGARPIGKAAAGRRGCRGAPVARQGQ